MYLHTNKKGVFWTPFFIKSSYKNIVFKACEVRETAVYWGVNEDFEDKRNAENKLLYNFYLNQEVILLRAQK